MLDAVERHAMHEMVAESALEVLIILSENGMLLTVKNNNVLMKVATSFTLHLELLISLLNECDVLGATVSVMKKHLVSPGKCAVV